MSDRKSVTYWHSAPPKLEIVGYELEIRPCDGLWSRYEGRIVSLVQSSGAEKLYRHHHLPDHGPASNGRTWVATQPYWARARTREKLECKLKNALNKEQARRRAGRPDVVRLVDTMGGWD